MSSKVRHRTSSATFDRVWQVRAHASRAFRHSRRSLRVCTSSSGLRRPGCRCIRISRRTSGHNRIGACPLYAGPITSPIESESDFVVKLREPNSPSGRPFVWVMDVVVQVGVSLTTAEAATFSCFCMGIVVSPARIAARRTVVATADSSGCIPSILIVQYPRSRTLLGVSLFVPEVTYRGLQNEASRGAFVVHTLTYPSLPWSFPPPEVGCHRTYPRTIPIPVLVVAASRLRPRPVGSCAGMTRTEGRKNTNPCSS